MPSTRRTADPGSPATGSRSRMVRSETSMAGPLPARTCSAASAISGSMRPCCRLSGFWPNSPGPASQLPAPKATVAPMSTRAPPDPAVVVEPGRSPARRRRPDDPPWARPALLALLGATALLYLWGLGASGWANAFYSAAAQAGSKSWTAMFFGSSDASNFITVDKAPAAVWVMDVSVRLFGLNPWSILVPEALAGVASVGLLYATVRRAARPGAGLLAGAVLAATPAAALMFRFNNPDALLALLLIGSAYAVTRAVETGRTRWLVLAGTLVGFGFLAKMLQALLVLP